MKGDLLGWLIGCGPGSPTTVISHQRARESASCSVHEAVCLCGPNLAMKARNIPGEVLVGNPKKPSLILKKEHNNKTDELARRKGKQAESKVSIFHSLSPGTIRRYQSH